VDEPGLQALVYGGAVLGGGGGGSLAAGLQSVREALRAGVPRIVPLETLDDEAILATLSVVGDPGTFAGFASGAGPFRRAVSLFESFSAHPVEGYLASEVGPLAVTYGLRESATTGVPVVDAPANGRAHPLFVMGSLGLHLRPRRATEAVAVGGIPGTSRYVELAIRANVMTAARILRERAARMRAPLAVVRNPLTVAVVRHHAAVGALGYAQRVGYVLLTELPSGPSAVLNNLAHLMGGIVLVTGRVSTVRLASRGGFSVGMIGIRGADGSNLSIPVCNEFMAVVRGRQTVVAFPDLVALFDLATGLPLPSPEVRENQRVAVFTVPKRRLLLGSPMQDRRLLRPIEKLWRARWVPDSAAAT
jgi:uncharacterized protein